MPALTAGELALTVAAVWLMALMIPKSFRLRGFVFLLLTGFSLLLGVGLSLGNVASLFH